MVTASAVLGYNYFIVDPAYLSVSDHLSTCMFTISKVM